jgi:hypothetical protein
MLTNQDKFLEEHNKLSPVNLQADLELLNKFRQEKPGLFKDDAWPVEKLRRPFIVWLSGQQTLKKNQPKAKFASVKKTAAAQAAKEKGKQLFHSYPLEEA